MLRLAALSDICHQKEIYYDRIFTGSVEEMLIYQQPSFGRVQRDTLTIAYGQSQNNGMLVKPHFLYETCEPINVCS